mmetsp:Transcript_10613/g.23013  ORF Transcript_10613/g.23013 Transcript_10613/m.23013 type:complete len:121 (+) Transcript_10613:71-433(+)
MWIAYDQRRSSAPPSAEKWPPTSVFGGRDASDKRWQSRNGYRKGDDSVGTATRRLETPPTLRPLGGTGDGGPPWSLAETGGRAVGARRSDRGTRAFFTRLVYLQTDWFLFGRAGVENELI